MNRKIWRLITVLSLTVSLTGCGNMNSEIKDKPNNNETANQENNTVSETVTQDNKISQTNAEAIALKHAGFSTEEVSNLRTEYDYDDGRYEYDIEFYANGFEYSYEIDAFTGEILKSEKDTD